MDRRGFIKTCTAVAAASLASPSFFLSSLKAQELELKPYKKAVLLKKDGTPLKPEDIDPAKQYIFFYPYRSTPCVLANLGKEVPPTEVKLSNGTSYTWQGGVGPRKSIVAYCAICPHQLSYPTPEFSFINYYPENIPSKIVKKGGIIQCCAHLSVFDPSQGGRVIDGPAPFPLTAIVLSYEDGKLYAVGTLGKELYEDFFDAFKPDLRERYGSSRKAKQLVDKCEVIEVNEYAKEVIRC
ncbi:secreted protein [Hydrogenivirga caldilitoris]|uniref:Secreted protein n=1 Tax=Hydrogenivirga caldilitoris TaxID=246264 RepID=A0A497XVH8_9AQUI|nr:twin-arginine translocation signal domain-containing protein [Hydrogenivirga caldilitoris]RLJ71152.1 secreted protein [Hydrogenivirga caldilitoris]